MKVESNNIIKPSGTIWQRGIYMLLFGFLLGVAKFVVFTVVVLQFLFVLFTGSPNAQLLLLGQSLSSYLYQIVLFLTFNSEGRPYPFSDWPAQ